MYAIGQVTAADVNKLKYITVLKCPEPKYVNRQWANDQNVQAGEIYLIEFEPQDQFCTVVPLTNIKEAL
jgi:hypothetical protein